VSLGPEKYDGGETFSGTLNPHEPKDRAEVAKEGIALAEEYRVKAEELRDGLAEKVAALIEGQGDNEVRYVLDTVRLELKGIGPLDGVPTFSQLQEAAKPKAEEKPPAKPVQGKQAQGKQGKAA
jgi:hypothetical protein